MRGLLLVELLLTLSIIALFSAYTLQGWQHQQQRLALEDSSSALLAFLAQVHSLANQRQQTLTVQHQRSATGHWCLWARELSQHPRCEAAPLHWILPHSTVQLLTTPHFPRPRFQGGSGATAATRLQLRNGPYQIRVVLSSKGRLSRCSEQANFTTLRPCR
jgi:Tfp pilus assembly protein FimT